MPALPPVPQVFSCVVGFSIGEDPLSTVKQYVRYSGSGPTNTDAATMAANVHTNVSTNILPAVHSSISCNRVTITDLSSATGGQAVNTGITAGSETGSLLPANACVLWNMHVARRYRGGKPRNYWPMGVQGDLLDNQKWTAAAITKFGNALNAYISALVGMSWTGGNGVQHVNVSYYEGFLSDKNPVTGRTKDIPTLRVGGPLIDNISSRSVNPVVGSQRRRLRATGA